MVAIVAGRIPEIIAAGRRLGRHIWHDERSLLHPAPRAPKVVSVQHTAAGLPLNQGSVGDCTANALCGALNSAPDYAGRLRTETDAITLYERETADEGYPYPAYDPGGSGLAVCKAAVELGWIRSYTHAFGLQHALQALVLRPVITGVNWYSSFDTPDVNGVVSVAPGSVVRGGHELVADGIDAPNQLVWFWNSWGTVFALDGRFCMSFSTWDQLLQNQGDVTVPIR